MGMKSELRRRLSKTEGRLRREGRRLASVFLCGALIVGNLSAVPVSVLADDDNDYTYEIEKTALQAALQTAVSEGNTVSEELEFAGEHAEEYAELLEADGTLYELELSDDDEEEKDDEEKERDKALDLRIFVRIDGDIPVDEAYEIDGSEEIVFLLSNKTEAAVTATICVDDLETEVITILPADSIPVEEESVEADAAAVTRGVSAGGSGSGGSGGSAGSTAATEVTETAEEELEIEITDATDEEKDSASITEDSEVSIVNDNSNSSIAADEDTVTAGAEEKNDSSDPEEAENAEDKNADSKGGNTEDTDSKVSDADAEDAGSEDSDAAADGTGNTENENAGAEDDGNGSEGSGSDAADAGADDASDAGDSESGNGDANDGSGNDNSTDDAGNSDDSSGSNISEDSDVSVLGSAISIHNSVLLAAGKATDSDATASPSDASASDADKMIEGELYEAVRFDKYGAVAFVTTATDMQLDQVELVDYTAETDGVTVTVSAPAGALPEGAELVVTLYDEDSNEYSEAAEAIDYIPEEATEEIESEIAAISEDESAEDDAEETTASSGLAVLDISFMVAGEEVEPTQAVTVTIDASGILPEDVDASTIEVQHLTESEDGLEATLVADAGDVSEGIVDTNAAVAEFTVESFSTFTLRWGNSNQSSLTIYCIDANGAEISTEPEKTTVNIEEKMSVYDIAPAIEGYTFSYAVAYEYSSSGDSAVNQGIMIESLERISNIYSGTGWQYTDKNGKIGTVTSGNSTKYYIYFVYGESAGAIVLNLGNGNGILQDSDYSGGRQGSNGTDLRYKINVEDAADENKSVTINLPGDDDLDKTFTVATGKNGDITQKLGNEAAPYDWKLIGWINIATGKYYDVTGGSVTATVDLNDNNVFYADWIAESYDYGNSSSLGEDTKNFVEIEMFDYNELFNMYSASLTQSGLTSESWADSGNLYSGVLGSGSVLDYSFIFHNSRTNNSSDKNSSSNGLLGYVKDLKEWNSNNEQPYTVWDMDSASGSPVLNKLFDMSNETIGVKYIGSGNYLFQVDDDGYYYFDSNKNGAAYNQSAQRFYLSDSRTIIKDEDWNDWTDTNTAFFPYNEVKDYTSDSHGISDGTLNYWFGMSVEMDFYLPNDVGTEGGNQYNEKNMVFEFSGDDDVWVFVDDELALNISGIHSEMKGSVDFSSGEVDVSGVNSWTTYKNSDKLTNCSAGTHTLKVYYLERGGWDSNLSIKFNIVPRWQYETASAGTMSVTKEWSDGKENHKNDIVTMGLFEKTDVSSGTENSEGTMTYTYNGNSYTMDSDGYSYESNGSVNAYVVDGYLYVRVDTQEVSVKNNWTYTWELLDESKTYKVLELTNLSGYKMSSASDTLQEYEYWSAVGYDELNGAVTYDNDTYSSTGGLLKNDLKVLLTDGAQNGENTATSTFPTTYTGYVIDSYENVKTVDTQFSQAATQSASDTTKYTYGVTSDTYIDSTSVWTVELTGKYESFTESGERYYAPTFYLKDSSKKYLAIVGSSDNYDLSTVDNLGDATAFSYNSLGELNTKDNGGLRVLITSGGYSIADLAETKTDVQNVKIYVKQDVATKGYAYTITNTLLPTITLKKVDSETGETLSGAVFTLKNAEGKYYTNAGTEAWVNGSEMKTGENGTIRFTALPDGNYTLTEISAPDGYNLLSSVISVVVKEGVVESADYGDGRESSVVSIDEETGLIITVENTAGSALPETGGPGTLPFRVAGLLLMSVSAYLVYDVLKQRRNSAF